MYYDNRINDENYEVYQNAYIMKHQGANPLCCVLEERCTRAQPFNHAHMS